MDRKHPPVRLDAAHRDALVGFVRGYLHEDVMPEYGSAEGAAFAFARDASATERLLVAEALDRLAALVQQGLAQPIGHLFVDELRSAWMPSSGAEVLMLARTIRTYRPPRSR